MRIISGVFKGKKIFQPNDKTTRPLKDLTKESIFNIIQHSNKFSIKIQNSNILDLFSGVGSFGLECLSRGAKHVTFVENYDSVLLILKKNLESLELENNFKILEQDAINGISKNDLLSCYDIVFVDPPYLERNLMKILNNIYRDNILNLKNLIIIHRHKKDEDEFPKNFQIIDKKEYGISKIIFGCFD